MVRGLKRAVQKTIEERGWALIATDGGSKGTCFEDRKASTGIALGHKCWSGEVEGLDQTSYNAELWALYKLVITIKGVRGRVVVIIDNQAVACEASMRLGGSGSTKTNCARLWNRIQEALRKGPNCDFHWVPWHGKKQGWWSPPRGYREEEWRELNKAADGAATSAQEKQWIKQTLFRKHLQTTNMRTQAALQRLWRGAETCRRNYPEKYSDGKGNHKKGKA